MKKLFTFFLTVFITGSLFAQSPQKISYQAVVRDSDNALVTMQTVALQIGILQGSADGTIVYIETQSAETNENGLVSIEIGGGSVVSGDFATIDWGIGPYFISTQIDPSGGTNYTLTRINQLMSVPFALHAETAGRITGSEISPPVELNIGDSYGGGIVFYLTPDGKGGLIAAKQDQRLSDETDPDYDVTTFGNSDWQINHPKYHDAEGKEYIDWRVPDYKELAMMLEHKDLIGGFVDNVPDGENDETRPGSWYASCTWYYYTATQHLNFMTGEWNRNTLMVEEVNLRAVRSFRVE